MSGKSLAGRKALVTGGARGIGAAIAQALARAGASIMIADILEETGRASAAAIAKEDVATGFVQLDVTDDANWERGGRADRRDPRRARHPGQQRRHRDHVA